MNAYKISALILCTISSAHAMQHTKSPARLVAFFAKHKTGIAHLTTKATPSQIKKKYQGFPKQYMPIPQDCGANCKLVEKRVCFIMRLHPEDLPRASIQGTRISCTECEFTAEFRVESLVCAMASKKCKSLSCNFEGGEGFLGAYNEWLQVAKCQDCGDVQGITLLEPVDKQ